MEIDDEIKQILKPAKSVLLVWDVQNRLVHNIFNTEAFLDKLQKVVSSAKETHVPVIFSKITPLPDKFESPVRKLLLKRRFSSMKEVPNALDLTIQPQPEDVVIPKNTASMFIGTNFEQILRNAGITTIFLTGIATEFGVESTARDAMNRGFFPVIITDAVSSSNQEGHNRSLENMKSMMILLSSEEIISFWKNNS